MSLRSEDPSRIASRGARGRLSIRAETERECYAFLLRDNKADAILEKRRGAKKMRGKPQTT